MDTENVQQRRQLARCRVCRLPSDTLAEVHRERLGWNASYEELAEKLRASGHATSASALRRHFRNHVRDSQFEAVEPDTDKLSEVETPFDDLVDGDVIDDRAVTEAMVRVLVQRIRGLERAQRVSRNPAQVDRLMGHSLKEMQALERALRRLEEIMKPRQELREKFLESWQRLVEAMTDAARDFIKDHVGIMVKSVDAYLAEPLRPQELVRCVRRFERDWPEEFANRLVAGMKPVSDEMLAIFR